MGMFYPFHLSGEWGNGLQLHKGSLTIWPGKPLNVLLRKELKIKDPNLLGA